MKRSVLFAFLLCICMLLTACTATDPDNLFETPQRSTAPSGIEGTQPDPTETEGIPSDSEEVILYTGTYPYGNMQKNVPSGDFMLLGNDVMFTHVGDTHFMLYSYDLITGEVRLYCEDATCKHEDCAASNLSGNLEAYNGKLYVTKVNEKQGFQPVVFNGDTVEVLISGSIGRFFHHDGKLYVKTSDSSLMVLEEGKKEPRMLIEEWSGHWEVIFGDYLYANTEDLSIIRVDLTAEEPKAEVVVENTSGITDGQYIYYVDYKTKQLYRCDMDGSNAELLVDQPVLQASINFDEEYFYYRLYTDQQMNGTADSHDIYRFPKNDPTKTEKIATLPESVYQIFTVPGTGKIFVKTHAPEGADRPTYVMNTDGSDMNVLEIPEF